MEPFPTATGSRCADARVLLALAVAAALLMLPVASAQESTFDLVEVDMSPDVFEATLIGETYEGNQATGLRREIDRDHGNDDSEVDEEEVDAWRAAKMQEFNTQFDRFGRMLTGNIQINDRGPTQVEVTDIRLSGNVIGSIDDNTTVVRDVDAELLFTGTTRDRANVTFAQDFRQAFAGMLEWDEAIFSGGEPWAIDPETIDPETVRDTFWDGEAFVVPYEDTDTFASGFDPLHFELYNTTAIEEEADDEEDSPAIALPLILTLLGILVVALRRAR